MKKNNVVQEKSFAFAVAIVELCQYLVNNKKQYDMGRQLLRSGTSIGANIEEAIGGQSKKDFFAKLTISYKEARETHYWLRLLMQTKILEEERGKPLLKSCEELLRLIGSIQKTIRER